MGGLSEEGSLYQSQLHSISLMPKKVIHESGVMLHKLSTNVLVFSPDTDVFNIGITMAQARLSDHYIVQINLLHSIPRYIDIRKLLFSFQCDPDLAPLPQDLLGNIMLQLYIVTGCDFISYFSGIGKATFLNIFFQHAEFISGRLHCGNLSETSQSTIENGFLSFIRLIGTAYFKRNLATMVSR